MRTYLVGGAVRDKLLGYPCHEQDWVVVGATPQQMLDRGFKAVGKDFPVFLHPETGEEYALARTERKTAPGYTGFQFYSAPDVSLEEDLRRRDLTINAIAEDETGHLVDPYGGSADIQHKTLRHVSDAFCEDPVRILRVARFVARYHHLGFTVAEETLALMRQMVTSGEVDHLVPERVWKELSRALAERHPEMFIHTLRECGALARVMPELDQLFNLPPQQQEKADSQNRGEDALRVLQQACHISADTAVRFAALIHNLGTGPHLEPITTLCERLAVPKEPRDLALAVAEYHDQSHRALELEGKALLNLLHALDAFRRPHKFEHFLLCCEADALAQSCRERQHYPQAAYLRKALDICLGIEAKDVSQDGFSGKRLGEELRRRRAAALERYRQTRQNETSQ